MNVSIFATTSASMVECHLDEFIGFAPNAQFYPTTPLRRMRFRAGIWV